MSLISACGDTDQANIEPNAEAAENGNEGNTRSESANPAEADDAQPLRFDEDMAYYFKRGERGPTLSYGVPNTDNVAITIRCPAGGMGKALLIYFNRPSDIVAQRPNTLTLSADEAEQQLMIEERSTQLGTTVEVQTSPDSAPMRAYQQGAPLKIRYGDETIAIPASSEDGSIQEFFDTCVP